VSAPAHIGIVACSAEGAALCYRTICTEGAALLGPHAHPEVSMHTHSLSHYMTRIYRGDWSGVAELMLASADKLAKIGADLLISPDNTIHHAMGLVAPRSPLPWLHIAEVVADEAAGRGFRCLGLTGTRWLVDSEVYPEKLKARGLAYLRPSDDERDEINRIIMDELVYGDFKSEAVAYHQRQELAAADPRFNEAAGARRPATGDRGGARRVMKSTPSDAGLVAMFAPGTGLRRTRT
jgi:aspartate racemase